jgi:hypothetical protein
VLVKNFIAGVLLLVTVAFATVTSAQETDSQAWTQVLSPCWTDLSPTSTAPAPAQGLEINPVVIGCDTVDCCPTCTVDGNTKVDFRVVATGDALKAVNVSFDNLPAPLVVSTKPGVHITPPSSAVLDKGTRTITALPLVLDGTPPTAHLSLQVDPNWKPETGKSNRIEIVVDQLLGQIVVSEFSVRFEIQSCPTSDAPGQDRVELTNNTGNDSAILLMSERRGTGSNCSPRENRRAEDDVSVGNVLPSSGTGCKSSVSVFSDDNAMAWIRTDTGPWTDQQGDVLPVTLTDTLSENVTVWVFDSASLEVAARAIDVANERYNANNVGIRFNASIEDRSTEDGGSADCTRNMSAFHFTSGAINVYYLKKPTNPATCVTNPNVVFMGTVSDDSMLAHEFGHSLSLTDRGPGAPDLDNIMQDSGTRRTHLFEGQIFRMNMHCTSTVNTNPVRPNPGQWQKKNCPQTLSNACPQGMVSPGPVDNDCPPVDQNVDPK